VSSEPSGRETNKTETKTKTVGWMDGRWMDESKRKKKEMEMDVGGISMQRVRRPNKERQYRLQSHHRHVNPGLVQDR
jgi:hypothetical protein